MFFVVLLSAMYMAKNVNNARHQKCFHAALCVQAALSATHTPLCFIHGVILFALTITITSTSGGHPISSGRTHKVQHEQKQKLVFEEFETPMADRYTGFRSTFGMLNGKADDAGNHL